DGWSRVSLTTELYRYYETLLAGEAVIPVATDWTYRDFVKLENETIADPEAEIFFKETLDAVPTRQLIISAINLETESKQEHYIVDSFKQYSKGLIQLAKQLGVPLQSLLLAGHFKVLSLMSGEESASSAVTVNGRPEQEGAEQSLGLYLNSLPLAASLAPCSWKELIEKVYDIYRKGMAYRRYPLSVIQQSLGQDYGEVSFNYTHFHALDSVKESVEEQGVEVLGGSGYEQTNFDLVVDFSRYTDTNSIGLSLTFDLANYEREYIESIGELYVRVYQSLLADLAASHQSRSLLPEYEVRYLTEV
ncbi:condensation domain-containing protein, partial [Pseudoalteromonas sp. P1-9]|uniref:condensation domain-containing protein n=1 Tax=Pseudoalteromonas sp. P1-9 TaxID=1710354 RepID=UPI0019105182